MSVLGPGGNGTAASANLGGTTYAGGGGGGNYWNGSGTSGLAISPGAAGGSGGGGRGATSYNPANPGSNDPANGDAASANTGSGGGGGTGNQGLGGNGGSGIVILWYPATYTITIGAGLTGSTATVGSNKRTTITAGTGNVSWAL